MNKQVAERRGIAMVDREVGEREVYVTVRLGVEILVLGRADNEPGRN